MNKTKLPSIEAPVVPGVLRDSAVAEKSADTVIVSFRRIASELGVALNNASVLSDRVTDTLQQIVDAVATFSDPVDQEKILSILDADRISEMKTLLSAQFVHFGNATSAIDQATDAITVESDRMVESLSEISSQLRKK